MAFDAYGTTSNEGTKKESNVDFEALNKYVVDTCGLQQPKTLRGIISTLVDLGTQKLPDATYKLEKEDVALSIGELTEKYGIDIQEGTITKFDQAYDNDTKSWSIQKFVPQKPRQAVVYAVDFPDIMLDKGKFFGEEEGKNLKPLRLWIGGQHWNPTQKKMLVNQVIPLKITKDEKIGWTMRPNSSLYKIALGAEIIKTDESFMPERIDELLGKTLLFTAQVFFKKGTDGKQYYTEKLKYSSGLVMGMPSLSVDNTYLIQFNGDNDAQGLKEVRGHVLNTIKNATNYQGSKIQSQLEAGNTTQQNESPKQDVQEIPKVAKAAPKPKVNQDLDDDLPF
jgi:hypothetical protein